MKRWSKTRVAALALCIAAGCHKSAEAPLPETVLATVPVEKGDITEWITLSGRVAPPPDRDARLSPPVAGRLVTVAVRAGQVVASGDVLARVDPGPLEDDLTATEASVHKAAAEADFRRRNAVRTRALFEKGVASRQDAEGDEAVAVAADATLTETRSSLTSAQRRRAWAELRAPFDGVVLAVLRQAGDAVDGTPGTPVLELAATHPLEIAATAPADTLARLKPGMQARVLVVGGEAELPAQVARVARSVDALTGGGELRLRLSDPNVIAVLGASAAVRIALDTHTGVLWVPAGALRRDPSGASQVLLVEGAKTELRAVETGSKDGARVEIRSGLHAGDRVASEPVGTEGGMTVKPQP